MDFLVLPSGGTAVVGSFHAAVHNTGKGASVTVHVRRSTGLVHTSVLALVVVELHVVGLGGVRLGRGGGDHLLHLLVGLLELLGDLRDALGLEVLGGDLSGTLGFDLGEEHIGIGTGEHLTDDLALLQHLGEVAVVHLLGSGTTKTGELLEDLSERHDKRCDNK